MEDVEGTMLCTNKEMEDHAARREEYFLRALTRFEHAQGEIC